MSTIYNDEPGVVKGTSKADTIENLSSNVSIAAGAGNDSISSEGVNITVSGGAGNDYYDNNWGRRTAYVYTSGNDTIDNFNDIGMLVISGKYSTVRNDGTVTVTVKNKGTITLNDYWSDKLNIVSSLSKVKRFNLINNDKNKKKITGTSGDDHISNFGANVTIDAGKGDDYVDSRNSGAKVSISTGAGDDTVGNNGNEAVINLGSGNDSIDNSGDNVTISGGKGNNYIHSWGDGMAYVYGGGNDTIKSFQLSSKLVLGKSSVKSSVRNYNNGDVTFNMSDGGSIVIKEHWDGVINMVASASDVKPLNVIHNDKNNKKVTGTSGDDVIISTNWTDNDPSIGYSKVTIQAGAGRDFIKVSGTKNLVNTESGNDVAENWGSHNTINGGAGNDYIESYREGGEYSSLVGGAGDDSIVNHASYSTLVGGDGNDSLVNNDSHVSISGGKGNDTILSTWTDYNTVAGGAGNDYVELGGDVNVYIYSAGNDTIRGFDDLDTIVLGSVKVNSSLRSDDYSTVTLKLNNKKTLTLINCWADAINTVKSISDVKSWNIIYNYGDGSSTVKGTAKDDYIQNYKSNATISGGAGNDSIYNSGGNASINAGAGKDTIISNGFNVTIRGGDGNDFIRDRFSPESLFDGGAGNDTINIYGRLATVTGGTGNDKISLHSTSELFKYKSGDGNDTIYGFNSTDSLSISGGSYSTTASGSDVVVTVGKGKITLKDVKGNAVYINKKNVGGKGTNKKFIALTDGDDTLNSSLEGATISGGKGNDVIENDFSDKVSIAGGAGNDDIQNWSGDRVTIAGGNGDDGILNLGGKYVSLSGGAGNDTIRNDAGVEWNFETDSFDTVESPDNVSLWGGAGNDVLYGGDGKDTFIYKPGEGKDTICNYANGDLLKITGGTFSKSKYSGGTLTLTVGSGSVVFKDVTTSTTFNINNKSYKISGSKLK